MNAARALRQKHAWNARTLAWGMSQTCRRKRQNSACRPPSTLLLLQLPCRSPFSEGFPCPFFSSLPAAAVHFTCGCKGEKWEGEGGFRSGHEEGWRFKSERKGGGEGGEEGGGRRKNVSQFVLSPKWARKGERPPRTCGACSRTERPFFSVLLSLPGKKVRW